MIVTVRTLTSTIRPTRSRMYLGSPTSVAHSFGSLTIEDLESVRIA